jgi:hypothetical protein
MDANPEMARIRAVKAKYEQMLLQKKNVVGVGIGLRERNGQLTDQMVLTVMVRKKRPRFLLRADDLIPSELDGVPIDVKQVGTLKAL